MGDYPPVFKKNKGNISIKPALIIPSSISVTRPKKIPVNLQKLAWELSAFSNCFVSLCLMSGFSDTAYLNKKYAMKK